MVSNLLKRVGFVGLALLTLGSASIALLLPPSSVKAQTIQEYGVTDKNKIQDAVEYVEWLDAAHVKVHFKNGKEITFMPGGIKDNGESSLADERESDESGYGVRYGKNTAGYGCDSAVRIDIDETKSDFEKQKTVLKTVNVDIDFRPNADSDCEDGNEFNIETRNPNLSIAYFKWSAPNQITTSDEEPPGSFTKGESTASIEGKQYDVFLRDSESSSKECKDKLVLDRTNNKVMWYELDDKYDGNAPDDVSSTCSYNEYSFPRGNHWWDIANKPEAVKDVPPSTGEPEDAANEDPSCEGSIDNGFGWIICPALSGIDSFISGAEAIIESKLVVDISALEGTDSNGADVRAIWQTMARFASGLLVLVALVMIVSTALDLKFVSAYTIKKTLPNIVIAAVGIWLSWALLKTTVSFVNDLGRGLDSIMFQAMPDARSINLEAIVAKSAETSGVRTDLAAAAGFALLATSSIASVGIFGLIAVALSAGAAILTGIFVLAVREMLIILGIALAPIAIVAWILPNTKKAWSLWFSNMSKLLLMFPMIKALFAGAKISASISANIAASTENPGFLEVLFPVIIYVLPLFFLPKMFKSAGGILSAVNSAANKASKAATKSAQDNLAARKQAASKIKKDNRAEAARIRSATGTGSAIRRARDAAVYGEGFGISRGNREAFGKSKEKRKAQGLADMAERQKWSPYVRDEQGNLVQDPNAGWVGRRLGKPIKAESGGVTESREKTSTELLKYSRDASGGPSAAAVVAQEQGRGERARWQRFNNGQPSAAEAVATSDANAEVTKWTPTDGRAAPGVIEHERQNEIKTMPYVRPTDATGAPIPGGVSAVETKTDQDLQTAQANYQFSPTGGPSVAQNVATAKGVAERKQLERGQNGEPSAAEAMAVLEQETTEVKFARRADGTQAAVEVARSNAAAEQARYEDSVELPVLDAAGNPVVRTVLDTAGNLTQEEVKRTGSIAEKDAQLKAEQAKDRVEIESATLDARRSMFDKDAEVAKVKQAERRAAVESLDARIRAEKPDLYYGPAGGVAQAVRSAGSDLEADVLLQRLLVQGADTELRELMSGVTDPATGIFHPPLTGAQRDRLISLIGSPEWYGALKDKAPDIAKLSIEYQTDPITGAPILDPLTGQKIFVRFKPFKVDSVSSDEAAAQFSPGTWETVLRGLASDPATLPQIDAYIKLIKTGYNVGAKMDEKKLKAINSVLTSLGRPPLDMDTDVYKP